MKDKGSLGIIGFGAVLCAVLFFTTKGLFPVLTGMLKAALWIVGIGVVLLTAAVIFFAFRKPKSGGNKTNGVSAKDSQQLTKGRQSLMELRNLGIRIKNSDVRKLSEEICSNVDKIISTLKKQPDDIEKLRQFFNYYLPTLTSILQKFVAIEESGVPAENIVHSTINCLGDIKKATEKQYAALFDNDMLDMSVEMEALTVACKRDGLLTDSDFKTELSL